MKPLKILFIDDSEVPDHPYMIYLRAQLSAVTSRAYDGTTGLAMAKEMQPDLILLDLMMPGLDGFQVCQLIRREAQLREIPVIILTKKIPGGIDERRSYEVGADDYLHKPVGLDRLEEVVRTHFKRVGKL